MIPLLVARRIADAAFAEAARRTIHNITVVVADPSGGIRLALRSDAQGNFGFDTARAKAESALGFNTSTARLSAMFGADPAATAGINAAVGGRFMPIAGAVVVTDPDGTPRGAVSISGGSPAVDDEIVRVAVCAAGLVAAP